MTADAMLDLERQLAQLSEEERQTVSAYLLRLRDESPVGREEASRLMAEMDQGIKFRLSDLTKQLGHA